MAEEKKEMTTESNVKTPAVEVEKETTVAPGEEKTTVETTATATPATPAETPAEADAPDESDISDMITLLNEIQAADGGGDEITDVPENMRGVVGTLIGKLVALRDVFKDPSFKATVDDMVDQAEDGQTPSLNVAIARVSSDEDIAEIQELRESENYGDAQNRVDSRLSQQAADAEAEDAMVANFEESQNAGNEYADEMNYDDAERQELFKTAMAWFRILGDGKLTKDEWSQVDKMRNYDKDMGEMRKQIPQAPKKEVVPDSASMDAAVAEKKTVMKKPSPRNAIESMNAGPAGTDYMSVGKRKFVK